MIIPNKIHNNRKHLDEFVKYLDNVKNWAVDSLDIEIPDPNTEIKYNIQIESNG